MFLDIYKFFVDCNSSSSTNGHNHLDMPHTINGIRKMYHLHSGIYQPTVMYTGTHNGSSQNNSKRLCAGLSPAELFTSCHSQPPPPQLLRIAYDQHIADSFKPPYFQSKPS